MPVLLHAVGPFDRRYPLRWHGRTLCGAWGGVARSVPIEVRASGPRGGPQYRARRTVRRLRNLGYRKVKLLRPKKEKVNG